MHGSLENAYCMFCNYRVKLDFNLTTDYQCKNCFNQGQVRVDVVWFGEQPKHLDKIYNYLDDVEVFISIGTSNNVYPAAGFIDYLLQKQSKTIMYEFNIDKTNKSKFFDYVYLGPATKTLPKFINDQIS